MSSGLTQRLLQEILVLLELFESSTEGEDLQEFQSSFSENHEGWKDQ